MRYTSEVLIGLAPLAAAFPASVMQAVKNDPQLQARAHQILQERQGSASSAELIFEPAPMFNAEEQYIDIGPGSGHEYVAPGPNDLRGPCPG